MATFDPDQSLLPSVGGSITPMSGGGQEGGRQDPEKGLLLLESKLDDYRESTNMRKALSILAPTYFTNKNMEDSATLDRVFKEAEANESKIESEVLNFVKGFPRNKKTTKIVSEKVGPIENSSKAMIDVMTYISSQTTDDKNIVISLNKDTLVITMTIPPPPEPQEKPQEKPKEKPEEKPQEKPEEKPKEKPKEKEPTKDKEANTSSIDIPLDEPTRKSIWSKLPTGTIFYMLKNVNYRAPPQFVDAIKAIFMDLNIKTLKGMSDAIQASSYNLDDALIVDTEKTEKEKKNIYKPTKLPPEGKDVTLKAWKTNIWTRLKGIIEKSKK
jgi:hypothetical protein